MANNWNFNSGSVLNMLNSQLERNAAEERMTQQLAAEAENYRKLREHQMAMQEGQQGWQSGENVLGRQHDVFMQDDQQAFARWAQDDQQAFTGVENTKNRTLDWNQGQANRALQYRIARAQMFDPAFDAATGAYIGGLDRFADNPSVPIGTGGLPGILGSGMNEKMVMNGTGMMRKPYMLPMGKYDLLGSIADWADRTPYANLTNPAFFSMLDFFSNRREVNARNAGILQYNARMQKEGPFDAWRRTNAPSSAAGPSVEEKLLMGLF